MKKPYSSWMWAGVVFGGGLAFAGVARAQSADGITSNIDGTFGAGVQLVPGYLGQKENDVDWLPILDVTYADVLFFAIDNEVKTNFVLGYNFVRNPNLRVAGFGEYRPGREASDAPALSMTFTREGTDDEGKARVVEDSFEIGAIVEYAYDFMKLDASLAYDVGGGHGGFLGELGVAFGAKVSPEFEVQARAGATYANEDYMVSYFGIDNSVNTVETNVYSPEAGIRDINFGVTAKYRFSKNWGVMGYADVMYLLGPAANSPLVDGADAVGDNEQFFTGLALTYTF